MRFCNKQERPFTNVSRLVQQQGIRLHPREISTLNSNADKEGGNKMNDKVIINIP